LSDRHTDGDGAPVPSELQRSSRDLEAIRAGLQRALAAHVPYGACHTVGPLEATSATGMSSETLLFEATWIEQGAARTHSLVARVAPDARDVPVFPTYDLPGQFATIQTVGSLTQVPVPPPWWCEADTGFIGAPFFVMGRVEGRVPPDVLPYNFGDSWLFDASPAEQKRLQEASVEVLAELHGIDRPEERFDHLQPVHPGDTPLRRHFAGRRALYDWIAGDCGRCELVERGFAWLERHWPDHESPAVFNWGDSRIGNILYRDFQPAAVLDWEMATLGPRELDVAWMVYLHRMFEDLAAQYGLPGMPHFLRLEDVAASYERTAGTTLRDLDWYVTYSCVQMAVILTRTTQRSIHFGERPPAEAPEDMFINAPTLAALVERP
jgi:aminoglycoside phosphotransferase (APT) family kinase protein